MRLESTCHLHGSESLQGCPTPNFLNTKTPQHTVFGRSAHHRLYGIYDSVLLSQGHRDSLRPSLLISKWQMHLHSRHHTCERLAKSCFRGRFAKRVPRVLSTTSKNQIYIIHSIYGLMWLPCIHHKVKSLPEFNSLIISSSISALQIKKSTSSCHQIINHLSKQRHSNHGG